MDNHNSVYKGVLSSRLLCVLIIVVVVFAVYSNFMTNEFVYEDHFVILRNSWMTEGDSIKEIFSSRFWGFLSEGELEAYNKPIYRPIPMLILYLVYQAFGPQAWSFHLISVLIHALNVVLVFLLASELLRESIKEKVAEGIPVKTALPLVPALLFATHPAGTEAIAFIQGVNELVYVTFFLLALYIYIKASRVTGCVLSAAVFFLSLLCKETAVMFPALLLSYDIIVRGRFRRPLLHAQKSAARYIPFILAAAVYFVIRNFVMGESVPGDMISSLFGIKTLANDIVLLIQYMLKLLIPVNLHYNHRVAPVGSFIETRLAVSSVIFVLGLFLCYKLARYDRLGLFAVCWIIIPLAPVLHISAIGQPSLGERYLYLPQAGYAMLLGTLLIDALRRLTVVLNARALSRISILILGAIVALYTAGTIKRGFVWKSDLSLWSDVVMKEPGDALSHYNLANAYFKNSMYEEAAGEYLESIRISPDYLLRARNNLGMAYINVGRLDKGIQEFQKALAVDPEFAPAKKNLLKAISIKRGPAGR
jgi:tetratricopeptide (TPR) repeat protein